MKKTFDYLPLVQALELIVKRTMNLKLKREDPFGEKVAHSISDIRISFLSNISYEVSYLNGIARVIDREIDTPEILITVCIEKKDKNFSSYWCVSRPLPEILWRNIIRIMVRSY